MFFLNDCTSVLLLPVSFTGFEESFEGHRVLAMREGNLKTSSSSNSWHEREFKKVTNNFTQNASDSLTFIIRRRLYQFLFSLSFEIE